MQLTDNLVKSIFDNIRNFVLSSVVIAISVIILRDNYAADHNAYEYFIGAIALIAGLSLFSLNVVHAWKKLDSIISNLWLKIPLLVLYALVAIEFVRVLWVIRVGL
jgi:hypothetical protein